MISPILSLMTIWLPVLGMKCLFTLNCLAVSEQAAQRYVGNAGGRHFYDCSYAETMVLGAAVLNALQMWRTKRRKRRLGKE